jgi:DNA helicase II / ATP-dependent DNA helicase PcrA
METRDLTGWIKSQRDTLDKIIAETAEDYSRANSSAQNGSWFVFDLKETGEELFLPGKRKDLCYDRPTIGFTYSLWFHARRVNQLLQGLLSTLPFASDPQVEIFDLGGGTGALIWAAGLVYAAMKEGGLNTPKLTVINIDSSPFMLRYGELLWQKFTDKYPSCKEIKTIYKLDSWHTEGEEYTKPWLSASYLFDADENKESVASDFSKKVESMSPDHILLLTSKGKRSVFNEVIARVTKLQPIGYRVESSEGEFIFRGGLPQVRSFRTKANRELGTDFTGNPTWTEGEFLYAVLRREQASLSFGEESVVDTSGQAVLKIGLSRPPAKHRPDLALNEKQEEAASHSEQPTIIVGPAGSGKSIVLAERIKNLVTERDYDPCLRILLTTFNKQLLYNQLRPGLRDLLDSQRTFLRRNPEIKELGFQFEGSTHFNIDILHFDILPSRLGRIFGQKGEDELRGFITGAISQVRKSLEENGSDLSNLDGILEPDFILEEFNRVFYGLEYFDEHTYLTKERVGRGARPRMPVNSERRKVAWRCMQSYLKSLRQSRLHSFTSARLEFLKQLKRKADAAIYTHIFIDEVQDCTEADINIFYELLKDPNNLVVAGDMAQSVRLGASYGIPRASEAQKPRKIHRLEGSYRLPLRISECIYTLSEKIKAKHPPRDVGPELIVPYKGGPPGARPIVVYAQKLNDMCRKLVAVIDQYSGYEFQGVTILERDAELAGALRQESVRISEDTILRCKGMEIDCVLWSTRIPATGKNEVEETVYTILTRTAKLLIVALWPEIQGEYRAVLKGFRTDRIIFWDEESQKAFDEIDGLEVSS